MSLARIAIYVSVASLVALGVEYILIFVLGVVLQSIKGEDMTENLDMRKLIELGGKKLFVGIQTGKFLPITKEVKKLRK